MKKNPWYHSLVAVALGKNGITREQALRVLTIPDSQIFEILVQTDRIRRHVFGDRVALCAIVNVKSGACSEDCTFCSQSGHYKTGAPVYPLIESKKIHEVAGRAKKNHCQLGLITSGRGVLKGAAFDRVLADIKRVKKRTDIHASFGLLTVEQAKALLDAGVRVYHHNLETAPSFFNRICKTHTFDDRLATIANAKAAGLKVCCGGILGMGESHKQRVEFAFTLKAVKPCSIPLNFLNPVPGTPLGKRPKMAPLEALKAVAMFRLVNPRTDIRICGGRDVTLRELQPLLFMAGASGLMTGDYLTTQGRRPEADLALIRDLGLRPR